MTPLPTTTASIAKDRRAPPDERHDASMDMARQLAPAVPKVDMEQIAKAAQWARLVNRQHANRSGRGRSGQHGNDLYGIFRQRDYLRRPAPFTTWIQNCRTDWEAKLREPIRNFNRQRVARSVAWIRVLP